MDTSRESGNHSARPSHPSSPLYRQFFENAPYGFFIAQPDPTGNIRFSLSNPSAATLLRAEMRSQHTDYATGLLHAIAAIALQPRDADATAQTEREDTLLLEGCEQHVKTLLTPIYDSSGALSTVIGIIDDISLQKSREYLLALRESEFRSIAERIGTGVVRFDQAFRRIYVNPYVAQTYKTTITDLTGKRPTDFPGGESGRQYEAAIREVFLSGRYVEYNHGVKTAEGRGKHCRLMLFPEWLPTGEVGSVLAIGQGEDESRESLRLMRSVQGLDAGVMSASGAVFCFTPEGECTYRNKAADRLLLEAGQESGLSPETVHGPAHSFVIETRTAIRELVSTGEPVEKELAWIDANQHYHHYQVRYVPKRSLQGDIASVFVIASKIEAPDSRQGQAALDRAAQHEAAREDERRRIALEIHDELGQLLTALRFRLALLRPQLEAGNKLIEKGLQEILHIIDRGSQEVQRITTNARPIKMNMGLKAALASLIGDISSHTGISFEMDIEDQETLDETSATVVFRIVQESITNIARHSGAGKAWLSLSKQLDRYHLRIEDNGSGFDLSAQRQKSFGLKGIRERVMLLKGDMLIKSAPGQGTSIHITMPTQP